MALSDPMAQRIVLAAPAAASTARNQSGAQSPGATGHYANQVGANTNPKPGRAARQRTRRAPDSVPGPARGPKPTRTAG